MADGADLAALLKFDTRLPASLLTLWSPAGIERLLPSVADLTTLFAPALDEALQGIARSMWPGDILAQPTERRPSGVLVPKRGPRRETRAAVQQRLAEGVTRWCLGPPIRNPLHLNRQAIADANGYTVAYLDNLLTKHRLTQAEVIAPAWALWNHETRETRWV